MWNVRRRSELDPPKREAARVEVMWVFVAPFMAVLESLACDLGCAETTYLNVAATVSGERYVTRFDDGRGDGGQGASALQDSQAVETASSSTGGARTPRRRRRPARRQRASSPRILRAGAVSRPRVTPVGESGSVPAVDPADESVAAVRASLVPDDRPERTDEKLGGVALAKQGNGLVMTPRDANESGVRGKEGEGRELPADVRTVLEEARAASVTHQDLALRSIAKEVRDIGNRQLNYERKYVLNSVFAYVIFCVLIFAGLYFVFEMRSAKNLADADAYEADVQRLTERISIAETELEKAREASHFAFEVYQLIEQARHDEALARFVAVRDRLINPAEVALLQAQIDVLQWKLAENAYREGLDLFGRGSFEQARDAFFHSQSYQTETPYSHLLNYHLATCLFELGDFAGARHTYESALEHDLPSDLDAEARYRQAVSTEELGEADKAYELYQRFVKRRRYHKHSDDVVRRMGRIERARLRSRSASQAASRERAKQRQEAEAAAN